MPRLTDIVAPSFYDLHNSIKADGLDEVWLKGGRGSTKSSFTSIEVILGMMRDKDSNAVVTRRYDNELRDSVFGQYKWAATKLEVDHLWRFMVSPMQAIYTPTGQQILFKGADNPLKLKSINIGHGYIKFFHAEEIDQFGGFEEIRNIMQSLFRGENKRRTAIFSYNPPKSGRSWVNQETKKAKPGRVVHHSTYLDVPPDWLGERFIADAEYLKKTNDNAYRHEYLGEEVGTGLEVFNNVRIEPITDEQVKEFQNIRQGIDWGYAVDPVCFERFDYERKKRTIYLFREIHGIGKSNRNLYDLLTETERQTMSIADSSEPKSIDEVRAYGARIKKARKPPGSVESGTKWLQDLEAIVIDPDRCPLAAREFVNYAYEMRRDGEVISRYPDKDNHAIDCCRYALNDDITDVEKEPSGLTAASFGF